ncbi:hypothetical protein ACHAPJ_010894 [Fusarium lateritium]
MVGIGGGVPPKVRLGDVVVSTPIGTFPGVVQWDFGKANEGGNFERTGALNNPPTSLLTALTKLETEYELTGSQVPEYLEEMRAKWPRIATKYLKSDSLQDILFMPDYPHVDEGSGNYDDEDSEEEGCQSCDRIMVVKRRTREFRVHHGLVASGNQVIKDALFRDRLNKDLGGHVLCVEMEAAGLSQDFPCLIIRGICDYADSHKNKKWQEHAAAAAAAFAKELLAYVQPSEVDRERPVVDILRQATHQRVVRLESRMIKDEDMQILNSLTPIDYTPQQKDFFDRRQPETGQWFLESPEFQNWLEVKQQTLFCPGIPGAGKTILASIIIDDLISRFGDKEDIGFAYIYCNFQQHSTQSAENMVKNLLKQLAQGLTSLPDYVKDLCIRSSKTRSATLEDFSSVLQNVAETYSRVFIVIDGLDECKATDGNRTKLLTQLSGLQTSSGLNVLTTSRSVPQIAEEVMQLFDNVTDLEIHAHDEDIRSYLAGVMSQLPGFVSRNPDLQEDIILKIIEVVDGMFLLAQFHLESLRGKRSVKFIHTALKNLKTGPQAYDHAYSTAMQRIKGQLPDEKELAMQVLMWITHVVRPLSVTELQIALAVEVNSECLDEDNIPEAEQLVSVCAGLVTIDHESDIIRLVHYTTQQYFERTGDTWFPTAHEDMARTCITYLSFKHFVRQSSLFSWDNNLIQANPLLSYALNNWGSHAYNAPHLSSEVVDFLERDTNVHFACGVLGYTFFAWNGLHRMERETTEGVTCLHLAAWFGLNRVVQALLERGVDTDAQTFYEETPLSIAIEGHHTAVVVELLNNGASCEAGGGPSYSPLIHATMRGFEDIVGILIRSGANINKTLKRKKDVGSDYYRCPLSLAAKEGQTTVFRMLLDSGADPRLAWQDDALGEASGKGYDAIVQMLLQSGADPEFIGSSLFTPLACAVHGGHEMTAKILLNYGAAVDGRSPGGITPLMRVCERPDEGVLKLLLAYGADIEARDDEGNTPLIRCAPRGSEFAVKMLVQNGADIEAKDRHWATPLMVATRQFDESKVRLLLECGANPEARDEDGHTPLVLSCLWGYEAIAKLLLKYNANVGARNHYGETPLSLIARNLRGSMIGILFGGGYDVFERGWGRPTIVPDMREYGSMIAIVVRKSMPTMKKNQVYIRSCLSMVIEEGSGPILVALLESSPELELEHDFPDSYEPDPEKAPSKEVDLVDILVKNGAGVNYRNWRSWRSDKRRTLLRQFKTVSLLLENRARPGGETWEYPPVDFARHVQKQTMADLLRDYGVKNISQIDLIDCA